jgi:organic hydroperoxide reductase OsmC/OhrA
MASYLATVGWSLRDGEDFASGRYSRGHVISFDGGLIMPASASPHVVGNKWSVAEAVDPEEMLVAAIASCHMLSFLHVARLAGFTALSYEDRAEGTMTPNARGKLWVSRVVLRPKIAWRGPAPDAARVQALHEAAHEECFIANSVATEIAVES